MKKSRTNIELDEHGNRIRKSTLAAALWKHRELIVNFELPCKYFHLLIDMEFPEVMSIVMLPRRIVEDSTYDCIRLWL